MKKYLALAGSVLVIILTVGSFFAWRSATSPIGGRSNTESVPTPISEPSSEKEISGIVVGFPIKTSNTVAVKIQSDGGVEEWVNIYPAEENTSYATHIYNLNGQEVSVENIRNGSKLKVRGTIFAYGGYFRANSVRILSGE